MIDLDPFAPLKPEAFVLERSKEMERWESPVRRGSNNQTRKSTDTADLRHSHAYHVFYPLAHISISLSLPENTSLSQTTQSDRNESNSPAHHAVTSNQKAPASNRSENADSADYPMVKLPTEKSTDLNMPNKINPNYNLEKPDDYTYCTHDPVINKVKIEPIQTRPRTQHSQSRCWKADADHG